MPLITALAIFVLIWWVVLFAVLPWGVHSQHEAGEMVPGTDPGAPTRLHLGRKLFWTTVVACGVYGAAFGVYSQHWVTLDKLMSPFVKNSSCYQQFIEKC
jgi:predicted secreted protein